jgi:hypothetical protein
MAETSYFLSKVECWLEVTTANGIVEVPVQSARVAFSLNMIPAASVTLAVGVNAASPSSKSGAHKLGDIKRGTRARIMCQIAGNAGKLDGKRVSWPAAPFAIFDGAITTGAPEVGNGLRSTIGLTHWLNVLDETHWMSCLLDVSAPESLVQAVGIQPPNMNLNVPIFFLDIFQKNAVANYKKDLWGASIKPMLIKLAENDTSTVSSLRKKTTFLKSLLGEDLPNKEAAEALKRMDDPKHIKPGTLPLLSGMEDPGGQISSKFIGALGLTFWSLNGSPTLWSKILRFAKYNQAAIVPTVETATIVPFVPTLNKKWLTLEEDDIWAIAANSFIPRMWRGVALLPRGASPWSSAAAKGNEPAMACALAGLYDVVLDGIPKDLLGKSAGTMKFDYAPPWLQNDIMRPVDQYGAAIRTALNPAAKPKGNANSLKIGVEAYQKIGDAIAKGIFMQEVFKARGGAVATRLRFDIAPGSIIRFRGGNKGFNVPGYTAEGVVAMVSAVRISIESSAGGGGRCGTTLDFTHMRLDHESPFTMDAHPFFGNSWPGGPLVNLPGLTPELGNTSPADSDSNGKGGGSPFDGSDADTNDALSQDGTGEP